MEFCRRDQDTVKLAWTEDGLVEMQGQGSNGSKSHWPPIYAPHWNNGQVAEDGVTPPKPSVGSVASANKDSTLDAVVNDTTTETPVAPNIDYHDDEMVSWLQYPLDDSLERNYCSEFFGELPNSNMQVVKESLVGQGTGRLPRMPVSNTGTDTVVNKASSAEAAMALGAGRAAGVIPQTGAEAFSKVRTLQPSFSKWQTHSIPTSSKGFGAYPTASLPRTSLPASRPLLAPMAPPKPQPRAGTHIMQADSARKLAPVNFSHFSTSAAIIRNYQGAGVLSGTPSNTLCKLPLAKLDVDASTSTGSSISESTTKGRSGIGSQKDIEIHLQGSDSQQQSPGVDAGETVPIPVTRKEVEMPLLEGDSVICDTKPTEQDTLRTSVVTDSAVLESADKEMPQGRKVPDSQEPTVTSSGGSGNSAERTKEASTSNKRKAKLTEETDCQSEVSTFTLVYRDTCSPSNLLVVGESFGKRFRRGTAESTIVEGLAFRRQVPSLCFYWHQILEFNFTHALQSGKCLCTMLPTSLICLMGYCPCVKQSPCGL